MKHRQGNKLRQSTIQRTIDASAIDLDVAKRALAKLDEEIAEKEATLRKMEAQRDSVAHAAVRELAADTVARGADRRS